MISMRRMGWLGGCAGLTLALAVWMNWTLPMGQLATAGENSAAQDAEEEGVALWESDAWQKIPTSNPQLRKIVLLPISKFYGVNDASVKVRVLCDKQAILTDAHTSSSRAQGAEPFREVNLFFEQSDAPSAAQYGAEYEDLFDLGLVDLPVALHSPSVAVGDTKLRAKWLDPVWGLVEGPESELTQIKVDLDGREPGSSGLKDVEEAVEDDPGVLLSSGRTELVIQPIIEGPGLASGVLRLTWPTSLDGNKKLEVN